MQTETAEKFFWGPNLLSQSFFYVPTGGRTDGQTANLLGARQAFELA
jgi:hypothetical protein